MSNELPNYGGRIIEPGKERKPAKRPVMICPGAADTYGTVVGLGNSPEVDESAFGTVVDSRVVDEGRDDFRAQLALQLQEHEF